jgi:hypothetical protein
MSGRSVRARSRVLCSFVIMHEWTVRSCKITPYLGKE